MQKPHKQLTKPAQDVYETSEVHTTKPTQICRQKNLEWHMAKQPEKNEMQKFYLLSEVDSSCLAIDLRSIQARSVEYG